MTTSVGRSLELHDVRKSFDGVQAVDGMSLRIPHGGVTALIGPNGAGKTTLFNLCTGFLRPDSGSIRFGEQDLSGMSPHRIASMGIARTFQDLRLIRRMTVLENLLLAMPHQSGETVCGALWGARSRREEMANQGQADELLTFVGLAYEGNALAGALSYGQQKLLALACCLATGAQMLLLDEPVAGIAPDMVERIIARIRSLKSQGLSILFVEHNLAAVQEVADRVVVMDEGRKIADGSWERVSQEPDVVEAYLA